MTNELLTCPRCDATIGIRVDAPPPGIRVREFSGPVHTSDDCIRELRMMRDIARQQAESTLAEWHRAQAQIGRLREFLRVDERSGI